MAQSRIRWLLPLFIAAIDADLGLAKIRQAVNDEFDQTLAQVYLDSQLH